MSSSSASKRETGKRHSCFYCHMEFDNFRALGDHLLVHRDEISSRRSWRYGSSSSHVGLYPFTNRLPHNPSASGVNPVGWTTREGTRSFNRDSVRTLLHHNPNVHLAVAVTDPCLSLDLNQSCGSNCSNFPNHDSDSLHKVVQTNEETSYTQERMKRPLSGDVPEDANASKRPMITSDFPMQVNESQKMESVPCKDKELPVSGVKISSDGKKGGEEDVDLSLHL